MSGFLIRSGECHFTTAEESRQKDMLLWGNIELRKAGLIQDTFLLSTLQSCYHFSFSSGAFMAEANNSSSDRGGLGTSRTGAHTPQVPSLKVGMVLSDERVDFLREQAFCVLRVKTDKWNRFIGTEENQKVILDFLDHIWTNRLLLFTGPGGTLHAGDSQVEFSIEVAITTHLLSWILLHISLFFHFV